MRTLVLILIISFSVPSNSNNIGSNTGLELPRFVSLKSDDANIRVGPSVNYPIVLKYTKANLPLKIIEEYNDWRKIEDIYSNIGWIHKSLIKGERRGIIISTDNSNVKLHNIEKGKIFGEIEVGAIVLISKCKKEWCQIEKNNIKGWIDKKNIWGSKKDEIFKFGFFQNLLEQVHKSINWLEGELNL